MTTKKTQLNYANENGLSARLAEMQFGDVCRALPVSLYKKAPTAGTVATGNLTTVDVIKLPDDAKCASVQRATVRAGGSVGEFTMAAPNATPTTTQCGVTPCGDIAFVHATDEVTSADVHYTPMKGEVVEFTGTPATGVLALPAEWTTRGVLMLLEAEVLAGTTLGGKIVLAPLAGGGAGLPATTKAQLTSNMSTVSFNNSTDAPTSCRVKCLIAPAAAGDMNLLLDDAATF